MTKQAWMFTSPGAHLTGALRSLVDQNAAYRTILKTVDEVAGDYGWEAVSPRLLGAAPEDLDQRPEHLWLGFYATSLVLTRALSESGAEADIMFGHSSGEITALVATGSIGEADGARLLCERYRAVTQAEVPDGAMLAVNASVRRVTAMIELVDEGSLTVAVDNGPRQIVVSGRVCAVETCQRLADSVGVRVTRLGIPGAYHNPMFWAASRRFAEATADIPVHSPGRPVYSPQLRRHLHTADDVRELIAGLLVLPVMFRETLSRLYADGAETFVEVGAGQVLSDLVSENLPAAARAVPLLPGRAAAQALPALLASLARPEAAPFPSLRASSTLPPAAARQSEPVLPAPVPGPVAARSAALEATASPAALPSRGELVIQVRQVFADIVQYPVDVVEPDADLEAELGVSSLKKTQAIVRLLDQFNLPTPTADRQTFSCRTVEQVAELLEQLAADD
ncbi:acyltransferase domain-containing protein [Streptomyces sp. NPDC006733]|uniref:acyltransferase domain-containing protein n=1 Tax=Streptomyces sp. NPDC006733 TaxID=3155460 RepID=UPI0034008D3C